MKSPRVAILSHFYPPSPAGGAAIYARNLAKGLHYLDYEVGVLCVDKWGEGDSYISDFDDDTYEDIPVRRLHVNWKLAERPFDYLFDSPPIGKEIERYLLSTRPDIVHIISTYTLSVQAINIPKILDIPVVVHLVDMWFVCPRHTLLRKSGAICQGSRGDWDCQNCMLWGTKAHKLVGFALEEKKFGGLFNLLSNIDPLTRSRGFRGLLGDIGKRRKIVLHGLTQADAVIAPSQFIRQVYESNGFPEDVIRYIPHGHKIDWAQGVRRIPSDNVCFGFLGNVTPLKGVHVLVDAFSKLSSMDNVELHIYGYDEADPNYTADLKERGIPGITWHGRYEQQELAAIFSNLDVVVFPSVWHENCPLVIQESFAGGCPLICSDVGGAVEWIEDGIDGLYFKTGDADQLAVRMTELVEQPERIDFLRNNIRPVRKFEDELGEIIDLYRELTA